MVKFLTDPTLRGKPDIEVLDLNQRLSNINDIFDVTTKPLIIDVDTGGKVEHFEIQISKQIDRMGISAVIMEDKKGLKKLSVWNRCTAISRKMLKNFQTNKGRKRSSSSNLMIIARIESLIMNKPLSDALKRS